MLINQLYNARRNRLYTFVSTALYRTVMVRD